jgi:hypothetical protein
MFSEGAPPMNQVIESVITDPFFKSICHLYTDKEEAQIGTFDKAPALLIDITSLASVYTHCLVSSSSKRTEQHIYLQTKLEDIIEEVDCGDWHQIDIEGSFSGNLCFKLLILPRLSVHHSILQPGHFMSKCTIDEESIMGNLSNSLYSINKGNIEHLRFSDRKVLGWYRPEGKKVEITCKSNLPLNSYFAITYQFHRMAAYISVELFPLTKESKTTYFNKDIFINSLLGIELSVYSPNHTLIYPGWRLLEDIRRKLSE